MRLNSFEAELILEIFSKANFSNYERAKIDVDIESKIQGHILEPEEIADLKKIKESKEYKQNFNEIKNLIINLNEKLDKRNDVINSREERIKQLEEKIKNPNYRKLVKLRDMQESLRKLEDIYYKLSFKGATNEKLDEIKDRIRAAKTKILILKKSID